MFFIYFSLPTRSTINPRESYYSIWRTTTKCFKIYQFKIHKMYLLSNRQSFLSRKAIQKCNDCKHTAITHWIFFMDNVEQLWYSFPMSTDSTSKSAIQHSQRPPLVNESRHKILEQFATFGLMTDNICIKHLALGFRITLTLF